MTIEVKQLIIKSTVTNEPRQAQAGEPTAMDVEQLRERLMEECREMIAASLNEQRER